MRETKFIVEMLQQTNARQWMRLINFVANFREISAAVPTVHSVRNQLTIGGEPRAAVALSRPSARADEPNPVAASEVRA